MDLKSANDNMSLICDIVENYQALIRIWPGYINGPVDVDIEGYFV